MDFSNGDTTAMFVCSLISILSCTTVLSTYVFFHTFFRVGTKSVVFYLTISNLFANISTLIGQPKDGPSCWFEAIASNIFSLSSILWTIVISIMIYRMVVNGKVSTMRKRYHFVAWILPIPLTLLPLINASFGRIESSWCWIVPTSKTPSWGIEFWYWESFYFIVWGGILLMIVIGIMTWLQFPKMRPDMKRVIFRSMLKLRLYPCVIIVSWLITAVVDTGGVHASPVLNSAANVIPCLQGFLTSCVFWICNYNSILQNITAYRRTGEMEFVNSEEMLEPKFRQGSFSNRKSASLQISQAKGSNRSTSNYKTSQHVDDEVHVFPLEGTTDTTENGTAPLFEIQNMQVDERVLQKPSPGGGAHSSFSFGTPSPNRASVNVCNTRHSTSSIVSTQHRGGGVRASVSGMLEQGLKSYQPSINFVAPVEDDLDLQELEID